MSGGGAGLWATAFWSWMSFSAGALAASLLWSARAVFVEGRLHRLLGEFQSRCRRIAARETPHCSGTGKAMAKIARGEA